jgi:hypothetical protein
MKIYYSLIALFFFIHSYGQDYPKMVVEGATFIYNDHFDGLTPDYFVYHIKGDTVINGIEYSILHLQDYNIDSLGFLKMETTGIPSAFLREDTISKKVYTIIENEDLFEFGVDNFEDSFGPGEYENEYLLYDFSLEVGDTLNSVFEFIITEIETTEKFDYPVRKFSMEVAHPYYEKFGVKYGLFFPFQIGIVDTYFRFLIHYCVTDNYDCEYFVGINSIQDLDIEEYSIYPNPANTTVMIETPNEIIQSIQVFSAEGQLLYNQSAIGTNSLSLDLSRINYVGLMHIVGLTENSRFVDRLIRF